MMLNTLTLLISLIFLSTNLLTPASTLPFRSSSSHKNYPISLKKPPSDNNVDIKDYSGFYVDVDLQESNENSNINVQTTVPMVLGLYTSNSLFTSSCEKFTEYDCSTYECTIYTSDTTQTFYPYFEAQGYNVKTDAFLNDLYWNLNSNATYGNFCIDGGAKSFGTGAYGILGMGLSNSSSQNYIGSQYLFSIYFNQDDQSGQLLFGKDLSHSASTIPSTSFVANNDWHISSVNSVQIGEYFSMLNGSIIFDINADSLGFPLTTYNEILLSLGQSGAGIQCPTSGESYYQPICDFSGNITDLPSMSILLGSQRFDITPEMYVLDANSSPGKIVLDIKALDSGLSTSANYVTDAFSNYIILGYNLMKNFYIVFDGSGYAQNYNIIQMYPINYPVAKDQTVLYVVCGCIGAIVILTILALIYFKYIKKKKPKVKQSTDSPKINIQSESSVPLIQEKQEESRALHFNSSLFPSEVYNEQSEYAYESSYASLPPVQETVKKKPAYSESGNVRHMNESVPKFRVMRMASEVSGTKDTNMPRTSMDTDDSRLSVSKKEFNLSSDTIEP